MNVFLRSVIFGPIAILIGVMGCIGLAVQFSGQHIHDAASYFLHKVVNFAIKKFPNKKEPE